MRNRTGQEEGAMICGVNPVLEALRAGTALEVFVYAARRKGFSAIQSEADARGVVVRRIPDQGFFDSRFAKGHQGVAARVRRARVLGLDEFLEQTVGGGFPFVCSA